MRSGGPHHPTVPRRALVAAGLAVLIAFAGQMVATNIFSNVTETDIDEYLFDYLPPLKDSLK